MSAHLCVSERQCHHVDQSNFREVKIHDATRPWPRQWSWQPGHNFRASNSQRQFQTIRSQLLRTEHRPWGRQLRQLEEISSLCSRSSMEKKQGFWEKKDGRGGGRLLRSSIGKVWSKHTGNVREQRNLKQDQSVQGHVFLQLWWTTQGQGRAGMMGVSGEQWVLGGIHVHTPGLCFGAFDLHDCKWQGGFVSILGEWGWGAAPGSMQDVSSLTRDQTHAPEVEALSPNHREVPGSRKS